MSRVKVKEIKNPNARSGSNGSEHEVTVQGVKMQTRQQESSKITPSTQVKVASHPHKTSAKVVSSDASRKKEEISINELCQRLETSNSGISIIDINDMPSTSRGLQNVSSTSQKRKESSDNIISWPRILSAISKDSPLPLKKLCIMDEVEITASKSFAPVADSKRNEPLDRRKSSKSSNDDHNMNMVFIKDEIDVSSDMEEDVDMDPLEVDELDNENADSSKTSAQQFYPHMYHQLGKNSRSHMEFPASRKSSNS